VFFLPWWLLLVCLAVSALASYLLLERTQVGDSPWALYPLTAVLAPVVLAGVVVLAIALSTFLSALLEDQSAEPPEVTGAETTLERTVPKPFPHLNDGEAYRGWVRRVRLFTAAALAVGGSLAGLAVLRLGQRLRR